MNRLKKLVSYHSKNVVLGSVADQKRFDADPDPTFQADADPNPFTRGRIFFFKSSTIVSKVFQNLSCVISQQECGRKGEG